MRDTRLMQASDQADPIRETPQTPRGMTMRRMSYRDVVLSVIAVLLAVMVVDHRAGNGIGFVGPLEEANASQPRQQSGGLISGGEQRKQMIAELQKVNAGLKKIETALGKGIKVDVATMPEIKIPNQ